MYWTPSIAILFSLILLLTKFVTSAYSLISVVCRNFLPYNRDLRAPPSSLPLLIPNSHLLFTLLAHGWDWLYFHSCSVIMFVFPILNFKSWKSNQKQIQHSDYVNIVHYNGSLLLSLQSQSFDSLSLKNVANGIFFLILINFSNSCYILVYFIFEP